MIESVKKEQLPACLDILKQSYENTAVKFGMTEENCPYRGRTRLPYQVFENEFQAGNLMYGYMIQNRIVGFLSLIVEKKEMHINDIAVLPAYQNRGIGSKLMQFARVKANELGCSKICLGMVYDNAPLRNWYQEFGFKTVNLVKFEKVDYTVGKMEFILSPPIH